MDILGFVILRHVISEETNEYWNECVKRINYFYPLRSVVIIDDNSKKDYVKDLYTHKNISIYDSIYHKRGELLPFIYFIKYHWFKKMIFIHDSCFFQKRISFEQINLHILPFWHFAPDFEQTHNIYSQLSKLNHSHEIVSFFERKELFLSREKHWYGIFGLMCMIDYDFLNKIHQKYNLFNLISNINTRQHRCGLERSLSILFYKENSTLKSNPSLLGNIFNYGIWNLSYSEYKKNKYNLPLMKVWTGR
jgi:hypothetical protein